jgi:hypothetical protein
MVCKPINQINFKLKRNVRRNRLGIYDCALCNVTVGSAQLTALHYVMEYLASNPCFKIAPHFIGGQDCGNFWVSSHCLLNVNFFTRSKQFGQLFCR